MASQFILQKCPQTPHTSLTGPVLKKDLFLLMFPQSWQSPSELLCVCVSCFMVKQLFEHNCRSFGSDSVSIIIGPNPHHSNHVFKINFVLYIRVWKKTRYFKVINMIFPPSFCCEASYFYMMYLVTMVCYCQIKQNVILLI